MAQFNPSLSPIRQGSQRPAISTAVKGLSQAIIFNSFSLYILTNCYYRSIRSPAVMSISPAVLFKIENPDQVLLHAC